jgi:hypothetical protein
MITWRVRRLPCNSSASCGTPETSSGFRAIPTYESLDEPFEIEDGVTIGVDDYDWLRWRVEAESALKRPVSGFLGVEDGGFYDGNRTDFEAGLSWRSSRYFNCGLTYEQSQVDLPGGAFVTHLGSLRLDAAFSPDLTWSNFPPVRQRDRHRRLGTAACSGSAIPARSSTSSSTRPPRATRTAS